MKNPQNTLERKRRAERRAKRKIARLAPSTQGDISVIDPKSEYRPLIEGLGGAAVEISATSRIHIIAMDMESILMDVPKSGSPLSLCEYLVGIGRLSDKMRSIIDRYTAQCYCNYIREGYQGTAPARQDLHAALLQPPSQALTQRKTAYVRERGRDAALKVRQAQRPGDRVFAQARGGTDTAPATPERLGSTEGKTRIHQRRFVGASAPTTPVPSQRGREDGIVYTVEGNPGDRCRQNTYSAGHYEVWGYAMPLYN